MLTRKEAKHTLFQTDDLFNMKGFDIGGDNPRYERGELSQYKVGRLIDKIYDEHELDMKAKDEEIKKLKAVINTSVEEIEFAIKKPQYSEVYLGNAIRFLKDNA